MLRQGAQWEGSRCHHAHCPLANNKNARHACTSIMLSTSFINLASCARGIPFGLPLALTLLTQAIQRSLGTFFSGLRRS